MHIYLIRHPQPDIPPGACYGQTDLALRKPPHMLAHTLQQQLPAGIPVFSSPLLRCRALAEAITASSNTLPVYDHRLQEMHFGEWEMQTWSDIPRQQLDAWAADPLHYTPPGGESVAQVRQRVHAFLADHTNTHRAIIMITHAGVMKVICGAQQQLPLSKWMSLSFDYGVIHSVDWGNV